MPPATPGSVDRRADPVGTPDRWAPVETQQAGIHWRRFGPARGTALPGRWTRCGFRSGTSLRWAAQVLRHQVLQ